jgi:hypothetical protein
MQVEEEDDYAFLLGLDAMGEDAFLLELFEDVALQMFFEEGDQAFLDVLGYVVSPPALSLDRRLLLQVLFCHLDALVQQMRVLLDEGDINFGEEELLELLTFGSHL